MALSCEEFTAAALEGSVGPLTLDVGVGAGAAGRDARLDPKGRIASARRHRPSLVEEARAEDEAGRAPAPVPSAPSVVAATAPGAVPDETRRTRDRRGRFVRRTTNGRRPA
jgi:hypothetical protein